MENDVSMSIASSAGEVGSGFLYIQIFSVHCELKFSDITYLYLMIEGTRVGKPLGW
jgi:hypothetical protein